MSKRYPTILVIYADGESEQYNAADDVEARRLFDEARLARRIVTTEERKAATTPIPIEETGRGWAGRMPVARHRGFEITFQGGTFAWSWLHPDYDGAPEYVEEGMGHGHDTRAGEERTVKMCREAIDEWYHAHADKLEAYGMATAAEPDSAPQRE